MSDFYDDLLEESNTFSNKFRESYDFYDGYVCLDPPEPSIVVANNIDRSIEGAHLLKFSCINSEGEETEIVFCHDSLQEFVFNIQNLNKKLKKLNK